jgi:hypothetical protein
MRRSVRRFGAVLAAVVAIAGIWVGRAPGEVFTPPVMSGGGETLPGLLPRSRPVPVGLGMGFTSEDPVTQTAPELSGIEFVVSPNVSLTTEGLPKCSLSELYESYGGEEKPCPRSLVGYGIVKSEIAPPGEAPASVEGGLEAFYGFHAHLFARVVTGEPLPLVYVLAFSIEPGRAGTRLVARHMNRRVFGTCAPGYPNCFSQPYAFSGIYGHISYFRLFLHRRYRAGGNGRSFVNASCPATERTLQFPLENVGLHYASGTELSAVVTGRCKPSSGANGHADRFAGELATLAS